jgi:hypothetical protein
MDLRRGEEKLSFALFNHLRITGGLKYRIISKRDYEALETKDPDTLYEVRDE